MAETMQFDLVSPERNLMSTRVKSVLIPGAEGDMTALPDHAPVITTLRPGILTVETENGTEEFVVTGGFAELGAAVSVLAEKALPRGDVDQAMFDDMVKEAHAAHATAKDSAGPIDEAAKLLADMVAMGDEIGLNTSVPMPG